MLGFLYTFCNCCEERVVTVVMICAPLLLPVQNSSSRFLFQREILFLVINKTRIYCLKNQLPELLSFRGCYSTRMKVTIHRTEKVFESLFRRVYRCWDMLTHIKTLQECALSSNICHLSLKSVINDSSALPKFICTQLRRSHLFGTDDDTVLTNNRVCLILKHSCIHAL